MRNKTASLKEQRPLFTLAKSQKNHWIRLIVFGLLSIILIPLSTSCNPEAKYETKNVEVFMHIDTVSAGFIECSFHTNKDAYFLIAIEEPWTDFNPVYNSKQFMTLALDSAYADYLMWRNYLLRDKEFNVAPFASHSLQYGNVHHFFTGLIPNTDYWVYAFPVDPQTMQPIGALKFENIKTTSTSVFNVHFDYRVKDTWDYIYPLDEKGKIYTRFPYIATTRDSLELAEGGIDPEIYFKVWAIDNFALPEIATVYYGVKAIENDGLNSYTVFEEGHTYYTCLCGFDGSFKQLTIYKFRWTKDCEYYFTEKDAANIMNEE